MALYNHEDHESYERSIIVVYFVNFVVDVTGT